MCGRFFVSMTWTQYRDLLKLTTPPPETNFQPNWNAAPTHDVLVCAAPGEGGARRLEKMRWGLIPAFAKETPRYSTINAMREGIEGKATWRGSLDGRRCVVPIDGFYEWMGPKGAKQAFVIRRKDGAPLLLAGLWAFNDKVDPQGIKSFAIITCPANATMRALHERMPVILAPADLDRWLSAEPWSAALSALLSPCPDDILETYRVGKAVGNVRHNAETLIAPIDA